MTGYRAIVVDPPWPQQGAGTLRGREGWGDCSGPTSGRSRVMPYGLMSVEQIKALPVAEVADPRGSDLYLWTTSRFLRDAFDVMDAWGWRYCETLVWAKTPMGHGTGGRFGLSAEFILTGTRGVVDREGRRRVGQSWWRWKRPYDPRGKPQHSAKPDGFNAEVVEAASPGPYLEMFARKGGALGWDVWGDQAPGSVRLPLFDLEAS